VNIPREIVEELKLEKGDTLKISLNDGSFTCRKAE